MLESKKLATNLWVEAMHAATYIQNRVPNSSMKGKTPFRAYFEHKPNVSNLRVFGSTVWAQIPLDKRRVLQPQSIECLFIGYPNESKGFKLLNIITKQILNEISVRFDEPLQEVELVKEKTIDVPSYSAKYLYGEIGGDESDFVPLIFGISEKQKSSSKSDSEVQSHLPTCAKQTLAFAGEKLEIQMIQEEPGLISKEQVLCSLVLIICYQNIVI